MNAFIDFQLAALCIVQLKAFILLEALGRDSSMCTLLQLLALGLG